MDYSKEIDPRVNEKMKKNLVYVGIFSVVMLFAGFTSAYIVLMGDSFWVKYPMPTGFWLGTASIIFSSITFILAINAAKKNNQSGVKLFMATTVLSGIMFCYFQFKGYGELIDKGINPFNNHILVTDGRYGDYFEFKYKGDFIEVDGNEYLYNGKEIPEKVMNELQSFTKQFLNVKQSKSLKVKENNDFVVYYQNAPLLIKGNRFFINDSTQLSFVDEMRLSYLARHIQDKRGDFFARGKIGEDFHIYFKGQELGYKNRKLQFGGQEIDPYLQIKATETADSATSLLYMISFIHLMHVFVAILYLLRVSVRAFKGEFNSENTLSLRLGAIFWHFLGLLWIYLLLFLIFIH